MTHTDIIIAGGGVIGLLTARELHSAGATVTVIDQGRIGQESSWAGGGILLPLYPWRQEAAISELVKHSLAIYPELAAELKEETGIDPEWNACGLLITRIPDIEASQNWCDHFQISYQTPGSELFSGLNTSPINPLWLPGIAQIRNPRLIKSLQLDLTRKGVKLVENCPILDVEHSEARVTQLITNNASYPVNEMVITAGAWTSTLFARLFPALAAGKPGISPVRGQMLLFEAHPDTLTKIVLDGEHYLIPRLDGHILAGSTVEEMASFDKSTTAAGEKELSDFALTLLPALANFPLVKHWAGLRPGSPGGIPYIGKHPELANVSINAGHFRNGLAMGPASARLIADLIMNRPSIIDPAPYRIGR